MTISLLLDHVRACFALLTGARNTKFQRGLIYLWNPATRQVKDISKYTIIIDRNLDDHNVCFGFGFDIASSDYKVVRIVTDKRRFISRFEVYSLNDNSWKEIEVEFKFRVLRSFCPPVVKGLFYWFIDFSHPQNKALFRLMCIRDLKCYNIFEFKQSLALTEILRNGDINIRILDDDRRWIEKFTITKPSRMKDIVGCLKTGEFVGQTIIGGELFLFDSEIEITQ
ncbi:hypothetical protein POM88_019794 [Heracleum sosnowskyi]|uniref:F-box associated beta-propeller type 1 domain-containing protein n=1 Tax=Heracleum sosnowskyi TaxID=360622 RepID=A0AAD8IAB4_9APIA|nr:hypothetical protein POM88_019794 [Heracleum sosnowskyi]